MPSGDMDPGLVSLRQEFLLRVLTGWVTTQREAVEGPGSGDKTWPSLCLDLGLLLQVNPDLLRRHLVCELYNQGLDPRAEQVGSHKHQQVPQYTSAGNWIETDTLTGGFMLYVY